MNERQKNIVDAIVNEFELTGRRPTRGVYVSNDNGVLCSCAVGVFSTTENNGGYGAVAFSQRFDVDISFIRGILSGFDGSLPNVIAGDSEEEFMQGYQVGKAVWTTIGAK